MPFVSRSRRGSDLRLLAAACLSATVLAGGCDDDETNKAPAAGGKGGASGASGGGGKSGSSGSGGTSASGGSGGNAASGGAGGTGGGDSSAGSGGSAGSGEDGSAGSAGADSGGGPSCPPGDAASLSCNDCGTVLPLADRCPPPMALDSTGRLLVAHTQANGAGFELVVSALEGASWVAVGGVVGPIAVSSTCWALQLDPGGAPVVAYVEQPATDRQVVVRRFDGNTWALLGAPFPVGIFGRVDLELDTAGRPLAAVSTGSYGVALWRFESGAWQPVGLAIDALATDFDLELRPDDTPVLAWKQGVSGSNAENGIVSEHVGNTWTPLGSALDSVPDASQQLGKGELGVTSTESYVAYAKNPPSDAVVKRWSGSAWAELGAYPQTTALNRQLALALVGGAPVVAVVQDASLSARLWQGTAWSADIPIAAYRTWNVSLMSHGGRVFAAHPIGLNGTMRVCELTLP